MAAKLAEELFTKDSYQDVISASQDAEKPIFFKYEIKRSMSESDARKLAKALRAAGLQLHYTDKK